MADELLLGELPLQDIIVIFLGLSTSLLVNRGDKYFAGILLVRYHKLQWCEQIARAFGE